MEPGYLGVAAAVALTAAMLAKAGTKRRGSQRHGTTTRPDTATRPDSTSPPAHVDSRRIRRRVPRHERPPSRRPYPGDYTGPIHPLYAPNLDGRPDPGEVVWTWVPYEDDHRRGKDRPVLLIGREHTWLLALMMTSKDHDRDGNGSSRHDRRWMDVGSGAWDHRGRPSEVRVDRIIRVHPDDVRREGAVFDKELFERVAKAAQTLAQGPDRW